MSEKKPSQSKSPQNLPRQEPARIEARPAGSEPGITTIQKAEVPPRERKTGE